MSEIEFLQQLDQILWVRRPLCCFRNGPYRQHQSQGSENILFDLTVTVELQQMYPKDLTATLERLTTVISPKLAQEQAGFHIDVKPSPDSLKSQGLRCFPERNAA